MIEDLIDELSSYRAVINSTPKFSWSEVEGAAGYDTSPKKKAEKDPKKYGDSTGRMITLKRHIGCGNGGV